MTTGRCLERAFCGISVTATGAGLAVRRHSLCIPNLGSCDLLDDATRFHPLGRSEHPSSCSA